MTKIIGISGKKQSGKNTTCNIIHGIILKELGKVRDFKIDELGKLVVYTSDSRGMYDWGVFDVERRDSEFLEYAETNMFPYVKSYAAADSLKDICIEFFGLSESQVRGSNDNKNTLTNLKWENMPGVCVDERMFNLVEIAGYSDLIYHPPGLMTAREFIQFLGTEIMRKMYHNVWVQKMMTQIKMEKPKIAVITDIRFPNEADTVFDEGGYLLRLDRELLKVDIHESETAMDDYNVNRYAKRIANHGNISMLVDEVIQVSKDLIL